MIVCPARHRLNDSHEPKHRNETNSTVSEQVPQQAMVSCYEWTLLTQNHRQTRLHTPDYLHSYHYGTVHVKPVCLLLPRANQPPHTQSTVWSQSALMDVYKARRLHAYCQPYMTHIAQYRGCHFPPPASSVQGRVIISTNISISSTMFAGKLLLCLLSTRSCSG